MIVVRFKVQCKAEKKAEQVLVAFKEVIAPSRNGGWRGQLRYRLAVPSAAECPVSSGWSVGANLRKE